jgi:hypothetical protein
LGDTIPNIAQYGDGRGPIKLLLQAKAFGAELYPAAWRRHLWALNVRLLLHMLIVLHRARD